MSAIELRQERKRLAEQAQAILDKVTAEKRGMLAQETEQIEKLHADIAALKVRVDAEERQAAIRAELATPIHEIGHRAQSPDQRNDPQERELRALMTHERIGSREMKFAAVEQRDLQADGATQGGYTTAPKFVAEVIKGVDDQSVVRRLARKFMVADASSLGFPSLDADPANATWGTEIQAVTYDTTMAFGKRELKPHPLIAGLKVSRKLLRLSMVNISSLIADRLAYKFAITENIGFLTGNGAQRPLGLFTGSNDGIPASSTYDISTDNTTTAITADGLMNALYSLKEQHQAKAQWLFHRDAMKMIRKLKDGQNNYLWQPGLAGGQPDSLLGKPFHLDENVPSTFTTGLYVGMVGNFDYYWIADAVSMELQRLEELYAETSQIGFIGRLETDGAPVLAEAFRRVKLA